MPPKMDPALAALIQKFPDRTPAELYAYLHGAKREDIALPPAKPKGATISGLFQTIADRLKAAK